MALSITADKWFLDWSRLLFRLKRMYYKYPGVRFKCDRTWMAPAYSSRIFMGCSSMCRCETLAKKRIYPLLWAFLPISFHFSLPPKFNLMCIKRLTASPFAAEGNQSKVIELWVHVSECVGLRLLRQLCAGALAWIRQDCVALAADRAVVSQSSGGQTVGRIQSAWTCSIIHSCSLEMSPFGQCIVWLPNNNR